MRAVFTAQNQIAQSYIARHHEWFRKETKY